MILKEEVFTDGSEYALFDSSNILKIKYVPNTGVMEVLFAKGYEYSYDNIPQDIYDSIKTMPSHGKTFILFVKDKYKHSGERRKVSPIEMAELLAEINRLKKEREDLFNTLPPVL